MNLNDLANLGQIIGAVAVVISLFYVASQIRQNTNAVRSATAQTVHEHFAKWYHLVAADDELSQIIAKGLRDYGSLSEKERVRFIAAFMSFLSYSQNAFLKWREGLLASPLWMGWQHVIMNLVGAPGGKAFWKDRAYMFGDEFRRHIEDDLMKREPHPDAKPMGASASVSPPNSAEYDLSVMTGVIRDGFGHVERGIFAAHIVRAHFAFGDDARDGGFKTRCHARFP